MAHPKKNTAFTFSVALIDSVTKLPRANPTLAAGDVKVSTDFATVTNLATLPDVNPASGRQVRVQLSASEMNGDNVFVQFVDQTSPTEWDEAVFTITPPTSNVDDLAKSTQVDALEGNVASLIVGVTVNAIVTGAISSTAIAASAGILFSGTLVGIATSTVTLPSGHGFTGVSSLVLRLVTGTNAAGKSRYMSHSTADTFTVDPSWQDNSETLPSGTIGFVVEAAPLAPTSALALVTVAATAVAAIQSGLALSTQVDALENAVATQVAQATALATLSGVVALSTQVDALEGFVVGAVALATALASLAAVVALSTQVDSLEASVATLALSTQVDALESSVSSIAGGVNVSAIGASASVVTNLAKAVRGNVYGTVAGGSSVTNIVTSALSVTASVTGQFQGRIMTFLDDTTTVALRGQATDISTNTVSATPSFTVTALATAPASGDTFVIT